MCVRQRAARKECFPQKTDRGSDCHGFRYLPFCGLLFCEPIFRPSWLSFVLFALLWRHRSSPDPDGGRSMWLHMQNALDKMNLQIHRVPGTTSTGLSGLPILGSHPGWRTGIPEPYPALSWRRKEQARTRSAKSLEVLSPRALCFARPTVCGQRSTTKQHWSRRSGSGDSGSTRLPGDFEPTAGSHRYPNEPRLPHITTPRYEAEDVSTSAVERNRIFRKFDLHQRSRHQRRLSPNRHSRSPHMFPVRTCFRPFASWLGLPVLKNKITVAKVLYTKDSSPLK